MSPGVGSSEGGTTHLDRFGFAARPWFLWEYLVWLVVSFVIPLVGLVLGSIALTNKSKRLQGVGLVVMGAGVLLWSFSIQAQRVKAAEFAPVMKCQRQMHDLGLAARIYSTDHNGRFPHDFWSMQESFPTPAPLICPADTNKTVTTTWWGFDASKHVSYEFLMPSAMEAEVLHQGIFRCPIHGTVTLGNGQVQLSPQNEVLAKKLR